MPKPGCKCLLNSVFDTGRLRRHADLHGCVFCWKHLAKEICLSPQYDGSHLPQYHLPELRGTRGRRRSQSSTLRLRPDGSTPQLNIVAAKE